MNDSDRQRLRDRKPPLVRAFPRSGDIVLTLQGGLGNQLFQWAFGRQLEADGRTVLYDRARTGGDRPYALGDLIPRESMLWTGTGWGLRAMERAGLLSDTSRVRYVRQKVSGHDESVVERLGRTSYLRGSFQSPKYFDAVAVPVREQAMAHLRTMLTPSGLRLADELTADPASVAVHVRRGDYVTNPNAAAMHGVLSGDYYANALDLMAERGFTRRVWFSDDPEWVRDNLANDGDVICPVDATVSDGGEIALMASCRAQIIANSSFSWWGGWLSADAGSASVIAPASWFADGHSDAADLIPPEWTQV